MPLKSIFKKSRQIIIRNIEGRLSLDDLLFIIDPSINDNLSENYPIRIWNIQKADFRAIGMQRLWKLIIATESCYAIQKEIIICVIADRGARDSSDTYFLEHNGCKICLKFFNRLKHILKWLDETNGKI